MYYVSLVDESRLLSSYLRAPVVVIKADLITAKPVPNPNQECSISFNLVCAGRFKPVPLVIGTGSLYADHVYYLPLRDPLERREPISIFMLFHEILLQFSIINPPSKPNRYI